MTLPMLQYSAFRMVWAGMMKYLQTQNKLQGHPREDCWAWGSKALGKQIIQGGSAFQGVGRPS